MRSRHIGLRLAAAFLAGGVAVGFAGGAAAQESDWPCVQRLVPRLEGGQMWSGPPLDSVAGRQPSRETAALAAALADPNLAPEETAAKVRAFAEGLPEAERAQALTLLFAAALDQLNAKRGDVIEKIRRYARGQQRLADRIADETRDLEELRAQPKAEATRVAELQAARDWDLRVHIDRQRYLTLVCEQPVRLEQRAFALARAIQEHLP